MHLYLQQCLLLFWFGTIWSSCKVHKNNQIDSVNCIYGFTLAATEYNVENQVIHSALAATTVAAVLDLSVVGDNLKQLLLAACTLVQRANKLSSSSNTKSGQSLDTQTQTSSTNTTTSANVRMRMWIRRRVLTERVWWEGRERGRDLRLSVHTCGALYVY